MLDGEAGTPSLLAIAHGAAVCPIGGTRVPVPAAAQGALVPASIFSRAVAIDEVPVSGATGRP